MICSRLNEAQQSKLHYAIDQHPEKVNSCLPNRNCRVLKR